MNLSGVFRLRGTFYYPVITLLCLLVGNVHLWAQFETRATDPFPEGGSSIATGDFNHDGNLDVVMIAGVGFSVALGNGDGTFSRPVNYRANVPFSLAVADFNNDGNLDIVVADFDSPATVSVYLGNGDGTFKPQPLVSRTTNASTFVVSGDFNGDGRPDIVVIDLPYISVLLGNGDGTFRPPSDNDSLIDPKWLAVADFNNDYKLDVLVTGSFGTSYNIGVMLGNGDGTLEDSITQSAEFVPAAVSAGDLDGDGNMDAVLGYDLGGIGVFMGNGDGTLQPPTIYDTTGLSGGEVVVYDLNLDGRLDVAVPSSAGFGGRGIAGMDVFWGRGDGRLEQAQFFASGVSGLPAVGDFNGDHLPDFVMGAFFRGAVTMLNTGAVGFSPSSPLSFPTQTINIKSGAQVVTLTNNGTAPLVISSVRVSGAFKESSTCGALVPSGGECRINAIFQPSAAGAYTGQITLIDSASTKPQFIELNGTATVVDASASSLSFGAQKVGTKGQPQVVTATNSGDAAITFASVGVTAGQSDFSSTTDCTLGSIAPGVSCTASVTFDPTKTGTRSAALYFNLPLGSVNPSPVNLTGTGK